MTGGGNDLPRLIVDDIKETLSVLTSGGYKWCRAFIYIAALTDNMFARAVQPVAFIDCATGPVAI